MYYYKAKVINVVDRDTIDVEIDLGFKVYTKRRIRLNFIDTPKCSKDGYKEATDRLKELVLNKDIMLNTTKPSKWKYYLGVIHINGENINNLLFKEHLAKSYDGGKK